MNFRIAPLLLLTVLAAPACADVNWQDPFDTVPLAPATSWGGVNAGMTDPCANAAIASPLSLTDVVDHTLCRNPKSSEAWANARYQAAQIGAARAPYLPGVTANGAVARNWSSGAGQDVAYNSLSAGISLSYLLYDFGGRDAALENAQQLFSAASTTQDSVVQNLFLSAIQGYYQVYATQSALDAAREAERSAQASLDAATARYKAGIATPADKLQAQTAHSQAMLNRIRAEGDLQNARGALANLMGLDADVAFELQAAQATPEYAQFQNDVGDLIAEARRRRPDLATAEAQVKAAQAGVGIAEAAGKPTVSLTTNLGYQDRQFGDALRSGALGVNVTVPLFTGFSSTYKIRAAREQVESRQAAREQLNLQIALDVWKAYHDLQTGTQTVQTSQDLVVSATQNADVALGRYKAGVGNIIDLITAQAALASARSQNIQAAFNWNIARAGLAYAMGQLDDAHIVATEAHP